MKLFEDPEPAIKDDIRFADRTEKAYLEFELGEYNLENDLDFIQNMKSW